MLCIANGKVKEKFDLSPYDSFLPVVKYDGDAHKHFKVITALQFDMQVPHSMEQTASDIYASDNAVSQQKSSNFTAATNPAALSSANSISPLTNAQKVRPIASSTNVGKRNAPANQVNKSQSGNNS